ncbi:hypothetical protein ABZX93_32810 [Streptomyces sp. NPDC006632]|uniref:hypothetical protein n=1 Tax=Streptomyces sp. NPDC006632 TaxID=3157182 RepID=UPI0033BED997
MVSLTGSGTFFRRWCDHGLVKEFHARPRARLPRRAARDEQSTVGVIDSQSVKAGIRRVQLINVHDPEPSR